MARHQAGLFLLVIIILYTILRYGCNPAQSVWARRPPYAK